jgi:peptidase families S8 and S53 subfamily
MKRLFIITFLLLVCTNIFAQQGYRYGMKFVRLIPQDKIFFVQTKEMEADNTFRSRVVKQLGGKNITSVSRVAPNRYIVAAKSNTLLGEDYVSNIYRSEGESPIIVLPRIVLMLNTGKTIEPILKRITNISVEETNGVRYVLKCNVSSSERVLAIIDILNGMSEVKWCEPEMLIENKRNNPLYSKQYYLKNTGQNGGIKGVDINAEPAWLITNGSPNITVAVIDDGVDRSHEDFEGRVLPGYTIGNKNGLGEPQNENLWDDKAHGTACAGIIAASNNNLGIRGIASNVNILPVNIVPNETDYIPYYGKRLEGFGSTTEIAEAINWAWKRADVLSCSWILGSPSNDVNAALDSARTYGRKGLGCIIVFASGNSHPRIQDVSYPANLDGVITVGAIDKNGNIQDYSQRGRSMDLVAPSGGAPGDIVTTDIMGSRGKSPGNYINDFNGTSAACPQVAGVAALILSVQPDLSWTEVAHVLQKTARDLGPKGFDNTFGYGLVNAGAAVQEVALQIYGPRNIDKNDVVYSIGKLPDNVPVTWSVSKGIGITSQTHSTVKVGALNNPSIITGASVTATVGPPFNRTLKKDDIIIWKSGISDGRKLMSINTISDNQGTETEPMYTYVAQLDGDILYSGATDFTWTLGPGLREDFTDGTFYQFQGYITSDSYVGVSFRNPCGGYSDIVYRFDNDGGYYAATPVFSVSPNPASDYVLLELKEKQSFGTHVQSIKGKAISKYEIQLWSGSMLVKSYQTDLPVYQIPISNLPAGMYFVRVIKNGKVYTQKLMKKM